MPEFVKHSAATVGRVASATAKVSVGALCLASKVSTFLTGLGGLIENGFSVNDITTIASSPVNCRTKVKAKKKKEKDCGCPGGGKRATNSYPAGTEALTPDGRVATETLHEGDLVVAQRGNRAAWHLPDYGMTERKTHLRNGSELIKQSEPPLGD